MQRQPHDIKNQAEIAPGDRFQYGKYTVKKWIGASGQGIIDKFKDIIACVFFLFEK